jgi:hypothetical protein
LGERIIQLGVEIILPTKYKNIPKQTMNWAIIIFLGRKEY